MSTGNHHRARAFTLIEVMVVVVIIAVLSGMAVLSLEGRAASASLRSSAADLLRFAQYARDYAVTRGTPCRLVIDAQERRFYLEHESTDEETPQGELQVVTADAMRPRTLPRAVNFGVVRIDAASDELGAAPMSGGARAITFTPLGAADAALVEVTDGKHSFTLRIAPATGRAEIVDGLQEETISDRMDLDA